MRGGGGCGRDGNDGRVLLAKHPELQSQTATPVQLKALGLILLHAVRAQEGVARSWLWAPNFGVVWAVIWGRGRGGLMKCGGSRLLEIS